MRNEVENILCDMDWFCFINGQPVYGSSNGGKIPPGITEGEMREAMELVSSLPHRFYDEENKNALEEISERDNWRHYLFSYKKMAWKGFIACDRVNMNDFSDSLYRVIAYPLEDSDCYSSGGSSGGSSREPVIPDALRSMLKSYTLVDKYGHKVSLQEKMEFHVEDLKIEKKLKIPFFL